MAASPGVSTIPTERSADFGLIETQTSRIFTLEHALDQALLVIADLREQLQMQGVLEDQLAEMESFSHIQHKAIGSLQQQLRLAQDRIAQFQALQNSHTQAIVQVQDDLVLMALKKEELETQVDHLSRREAQLQHQCLDLNDRCEQQETRIKVLEEQVTDLQEQVLQQEQQLREQETATQYWKGRYQSFYLQCQEMLSRWDGDREGGWQEFATLLERVLGDDRFSLEPGALAKINLPHFVKAPSK